MSHNFCTLYDNLRDPYQLKNIAAQNMLLVRHLIDTELQPWLEKTADPWRPAPFDSDGPTAANAYVREDYD